MELSDDTLISKNLLTLNCRYLKDNNSHYLVLMYKSIEKLNSDTNKKWFNTRISYWDYSFYSEFIYFFIVVVYSQDLEYHAGDGNLKKTNYKDFTLEAMEIFHYFHQSPKLNKFLEQFIKENTFNIKSQENNEKYENLIKKFPDSIQFIKIRDNYTLIIYSIENKIQIDKKKYPLLTQNMIKLYENAKNQYKK